MCFSSLSSCSCRSLALSVMCAEQHRLPSACSDSLTDRDVHRGVEQLVEKFYVCGTSAPAVSNGAGDQIGGHRALIGRLEPAGYDSGHIRLRLRGPTIATSYQGDWRGTPVTRDPNKHRTHPHTHTPKPPNPAVEARAYRLNGVRRASKMVKPDIAPRTKN